MSNDLLITDLMNLPDLKDYIANCHYDGILFCFGTSFISKLIQARTKVNPKEIVPSHVALTYGDFLYESTSNEERVGKKTIPAGVRRYLISDFFKAEQAKQTYYAFFPAVINILTAEEYIHYPYGMDIILDYALKNGSKGSKSGLICSQYGNRVTRLIPEKDIVTPAEMYRKAKKISKERENNDWKLNG